MIYSFFPLHALGTLLTLSAHCETLQEQLDARQKEGAKTVNPAIRKDFEEGIEAVREAQVVEKAMKKGDRAPDFTLTGALGETVTLSEELKKGPVVLTWYRGGWCPYCNIALAALQQELPAIHEAGATLIALTPELPDKTLSTTEKNALDFNVLTDLNHNVAQKYGLTFDLTPAVAGHYQKFST